MLMWKKKLLDCSFETRTWLVVEMHMLSSTPAVVLILYMPPSDGCI